jgi:hypothetical protein
MDVVTDVAMLTMTMVFDVTLRIKERHRDHQFVK